MCSRNRIAAILVTLTLLALCGCREEPDPTAATPAPKAAKPRPAKEAEVAVPNEPDNSAEILERRVVERRAIEAVIWGMPAVNYDLMYQAMVRETGGAFNEVVTSAGLEEPDTDAEPGRHLPDAVLQHEGRTDRDRDTAR